MISYPVYQAGLLTVAVFLDGVMTFVAVSYLDAIELNPIANNLFGEIGVGSTVVVSVVWRIFFVALFLLLYQRGLLSTGSTRIMFNILLFIMWFIVLWGALNLVLALV